MPPALPPRAVPSAAAVGAPSIQSSKKMPATRSPTLKRVTFAPTATTSPAPSDNGTLFGCVPPRP